MPAAQPAFNPPARAVPAHRIVPVRTPGRFHGFQCQKQAPPAVRQGFLTRNARERLAGRFWIGCVLSLWAVLLVFAGRDGIKPQDPSAAANIIRK